MDTPLRIAGAGLFKESMYLHELIHGHAFGTEVEAIAIASSPSLGPPNGSESLEQMVPSEILHCSGEAGRSDHRAWPAAHSAKND
jgi:hypothetical protein